MHRVSGWDEHLARLLEHSSPEGRRAAVVCAIKRALRDLGDGGYEGVVIRVGRNDVDSSVAAHYQQLAEALDELALDAADAAETGSIAQTQADRAFINARLAMGIAAATAPSSTESSCDAIYEIAVALDYPDDLLKELKELLSA